MQSRATVTQPFATWAAANDARDRLAADDGFSRYGVERIDIERRGRRFELLIRTDEFHRDQIEHLLRSSGTAFNRPAPSRPLTEAGLSSSFMIFGFAAAAGAAAYLLWSKRSGKRQTRTSQTFARSPDHRRWDEDDARPWLRDRQYERDQRAGLRSHAEGFAV